MPRRNKSIGRKTPTKSKLNVNSTPIKRLREKYRNYRSIRTTQRQESIATWYDRKYIIKFLYTVIFFLICTYLNSLSAVIAGFLTPQPVQLLPDLSHKMLDQYLPVEWMSETYGKDFVRNLPDYFVTAHVALAATITVLHPKRWNIIKRFLCIFGFINLLRAITVTVTLLPDVAPHCLAQFEQQYDGGTGFYKLSPIFPKAFSRAFKLMTKPDTTTCGDLIFSGHTSLFCLASLLIHQYLQSTIIAPFHWFQCTLSSFAITMIKLVAKLLTFCGMVAILATKFHYTIDVLLAAYLCRSVWNQYHQAAFLAGDQHTGFQSKVVRQNVFNKLVYFLEDDDDDHSLYDLFSDSDSSSSENGTENEKEESSDWTSSSSNKRKKKATKKDSRNEAEVWGNMVLRVLMVLAGVATCFVLYRTVVSNSDYSEVSNVSLYESSKARVQCIAAATKQCFAEQNAKNVEQNMVGGELKENLWE